MRAMNSVAAISGLWSPDRFFKAILCYSQSGDDSQDDLARFGYKLKHMKVIL